MIDHAMTDSRDLDFFSSSVVKMSIYQHFIHLKPNFSLKMLLYSVNLYYSNLYLHAIFELKMPLSPPRFNPTFIHSHLSPVGQHSMANSNSKLLLKMGRRLLIYVGVLAVF